MVCLEMNLDNGKLKPGMCSVPVCSVCRVVSSGRGIKGLHTELYKRVCEAYGA